MSLKHYRKPNNAVDGVISDDADGVSRLLSPDVVACRCPSAAPHHAPRLRINVSGQPFELPVALLARHPGIQSRTVTLSIDLNYLATEVQVRALRDGAGCHSVCLFVGLFVCLSKLDLTTWRRHHSRHLGSSSCSNSANIVYTKSIVYF